MRGLKLVITVIDISLSLSHPVRVRGLKCHLIFAVAGSTLFSSSTLFIEYCTRFPFQQSYLGFSRNHQCCVISNNNPLSHSLRKLTARSSSPIPHLIVFIISETLSKTVRSCCRRFCCVNDNVYKIFI